MLAPIGTVKERKVILQCSQLNMQQQELWLKLIAVAAALIDVPVSLELNRVNDRQHALVVLEAVGHTVNRLRHRFSDCSPEPKEDEQFALIAASEVFSHKLLAGIETLFIEPAIDSLHINPTLMRFGESIGLFDSTNLLKPIVKDVALISSVFNADRFLTSFLKNSAGLNNYRNIEHLFIRPNSPGHEHSELIQHVRTYPETAVYLNLKHDPGLYGIWNYAAKLASARYLSSANVDDKRAPEHTLRLAESLDHDESIDVVSSVLRVTRNPDMDWEQSAECQTMFGEKGTRRYTLADMMNERRSGYAIRDIPHCMPVWRRALHVFYGYYNEMLYGPSADSEFWIRVGNKSAGFFLEGTPLGLYYKDEASYWSRNKKKAINKNKTITTDSSESDSLPLSFYLNELRNLYYAASYLELCGRLVYLHKTLVESRELLDRTALYYLGSGKDAIFSVEINAAPVTLLKRLHKVLQSASTVVEKIEKIPYKVIHTSLHDIESML